MTDLTVAIDVLDVSRAMLSGERRFDTLTRGELVALLGFVLQQNDEPQDLGIQFPELLALNVAPARPGMSAELAAAIAAVLDIQRRLGDLRPGGTTMQALLLRRELFAAIEELGKRFNEEISTNV